MAEVNSINEPKRKKTPRRASLVNIILLIAVVLVGGLFIRAEMQRRATEKDLQKATQELQVAKQSTQNNSQEAANAVLEKVRTLINIPSEPAPTVATITDVDSLRKTNAFYNKAENGDNLIVTADRAILYSPLKNIIIDVVPVQISPSPSVSPTVAPENSPTATKKATK